MSQEILNKVNFFVRSTQILKLKTNLIFQKYFHYSYFLYYWIFDEKKKLFCYDFPLVKQVVVVEIPNLTFQVKPKPINKTVICTISLIMHKKPKYKIDCHVSDFCDYIIVTL